MFDKNRADLLGSIFYLTGHENVVMTSVVRVKAAAKAATTPALAGGAREVATTKHS
jgi:hypothetical protein